MHDEASKMGSVGMGISVLVLTSLVAAVGVTPEVVVKGAVLVAPVGDVKLGWPSGPVVVFVAEQHHIKTTPISTLMVCI